MLNLSITHHHEDHRGDYKTLKAREVHWLLGRKSQHNGGHNEPKWLHMSLNRENSFDADKTIHNSKAENVKGQEIYFSRTKKYNYMKQVIDKYFEEAKIDKKCLNPE